MAIKDADDSLPVPVRLRREFEARQPPAWRGMSFLRTSRLDQGTRCYSSTTTTTIKTMHFYASTVNLTTWWTIASSERECTQSL